MKPPRAQTGILGILWLSHSLLVIFLYHVNPNHYTTIDSQYYFDYVQWLESGFRHKAQSANSTFPPAYPLFILFVKSCTGLNSLWASKVLNLAASAFLLYLFDRRFPFRHSVWLASILLLGPFLKLWAHSWSEPVFLTLLFWWVSRIMTHRRFDIQLATIGLALVCTRYAGAFIIAAALLKSLNPQQPGNLKSRQLWLSYATIWSVGLISVWFFNFTVFDEMWGGDRFQRPSFSSLIYNFRFFLIGLINELFLFRNLTDASWLLPLLLFTLIQLPLFRLLAQSRVHQPLPQEKAVASQMMAIATAYLIFLFIVRCFSPFDLPGYRLLAPFSLLALVSVASCYSPKTPKAIAIWITIILLSWIDLLPYMDLTSKIRELISRV